MSKNRYEFNANTLYVIMGIIFIIGMIAMATDGDNKTRSASRCKYTAMEKHYSADDIIKLCGK